MTHTKKKIYKRLSILIMSCVLMLSGLLIAVPATRASAATGDDVVKEGDYYVFTSKTATRFWLEIPLKDIKGYFSHTTQILVKESNGFKKDNSDYTKPVQIRLDNIKYEGKPIMLQGEVKINMAGYNQSTFKKSDVYFNDNVTVWLFISAYNHLTKYKDNLDKMTITVYMNGTGLRVDSDYSFLKKDMITPFIISGCKLDSRPYDPQEDNPDSDKYNPQLVTDKNYSDNNAGKEGEKKGIFGTIAGWFNTSVYIVYTVLILICAGIVLYIIFRPKRAG